MPDSPGFIEWSTISVLFSKIVFIKRFKFSKIPSRKLFQKLRYEKHLLQGNKLSIHKNIFKFKWNSIAMTVWKRGKYYPWWSYKKKHINTKGVTEGSSVLASEIFIAISQSLKNPLKWNASKKMDYIGLKSTNFLSNNKEQLFRGLQIGLL